MKLLNHLNEEIKYSTEEIGKILLKDCQPYLREIRQEKSQLWRGGLIGSAAGIKKYKSRLEDRTPKDIPIWVHNYLNDLYIKRFGWPVRNGVFCYNDRTTDLYGEPYWMFPIGRYDYLWCLEINDLFHTLAELKMNHMGIYGKAIPNVAIREWADKIVNKTKYHASHFGKASPNNEISVNCNEYYIVSVMDREDWTSLRDILL